MRDLKKMRAWLFTSKVKKNVGKNLEKNYFDFILSKREYLFSTVRFLFIFSNISFGSSIVFYAFEKEIPVSYILQDIGLLGFELNAIFLLPILFFVNVIFPIVLLQIENSKNMFHQSNTKTKKIFSCFASFVFVSLCLCSFIVVSKKINSIYLSSMMCVSFIALYIIYCYKKSYTVFFVSLLVVMFSTFSPSFDTLLFRVYGFVPREKSEYLFKGNKDTSEIIKNILAVSHLKKGSSLVFKNEDGFYTNNPAILKAVMAVGDYVYFSEYGSLIRIKKDDVVLLGVRNQDVQHSSRKDDRLSDR